MIMVLMVSVMKKLVSKISNMILNNVLDKNF